MNTDTLPTGVLKVTRISEEVLIIKKYIYIWTPILSFWGELVLLPFAIIQFAKKPVMCKQYITQFGIRFILYNGVLALVPALLIEWLFQNHISPELYTIVILTGLYLSGAVASMLLCRWLKKIGL